MSIRRASADDLSAIKALERSSPMAAHWSLAQYEAILNAPLATDRLIFVAEEEERLQGFLVARTAAEEWEIENVAVAESDRRRGIGRKLVQALISKTREQNTGAIFLEVRESNHDARALYQSCGFVQTGRRPAYYNCPTEDAILYTLAFS